MFTWLKNIQLFIYERKSLEIKTFKVSKDLQLPFSVDF